MGLKQRKKAPSDHHLKKGDVYSLQGHSKILKLFPVPTGKIRRVGNDSAFFICNTKSLLLLNI